MKVELKTLPAARVAYMRHVGPYGELRASRAPGSASPPGAASTA